MATILFGSLLNGSTVTFNPAADILRFDNSALSAASVVLGHDTEFTSLSLTAGGKTVNLTSTVSLLQLTTGNVSFADGSQLIVGDDSASMGGDQSANTLSGSAGDDQLVGFGGDDMLDGGLGADVMTGGLGNDTHYVDNSGDRVYETTTTTSTTDAGGSDTVHSSLAAYTLGNYVENGRILASGAANLTGNSLNNTLYAGAGNNVINGSTGTDAVSYAYGVAGTMGVAASLALTTAQATGARAATHWSVSRTSSAPTTTTNSLAARVPTF